MRGFSTALSVGSAAAAALESSNEVAWVERDKVMRTAAQSLPTGIDRAVADVSPTAAIDGADTRVDADVAVIDTGVNLSHPDPNINTAGAKNCTNPPTSVEDLNGHGTHVSGTIGVAAGNDSADAKDSSPAAYDEVITVSALSDFDDAPGGACSPRRVPRIAGAAAL